MVHQYLGDTAEMIIGCQTEEVDIIVWSSQSHPVVKFSRMLSSICRHAKDFQQDDVSFVTVEEILTNIRPTRTLGMLLALALISTNPKARFQLSYPVYRVSGVRQRTFHLPDIGIRALQGHSRDDVGI